jgi:ApaG protein
MAPLENSKITEGIKISVETFFNAEESYYELGRYMFSYHIKITNESKEAVKLMRRRWEITDAYGYLKIVEGDGVIGEQPLIFPGASFEYVSFCMLRTPIGKMVGHYEMLKASTSDILKIYIPEFRLVAPFIMN